MRGRRPFGQEKFEAEMTTVSLKDTVRAIQNQSSFFRKDSVSHERFETLTHAKYCLEAND